MATYKLLKKLPFENSPKVGYESVLHVNRKDDFHYWNGLWFNPQEYPEYWQLCPVKTYEVLSYKNKGATDTVHIKHNNKLFGLAYFLGSFPEKDYGKNWEIHCVKRLKDNVIFTVGETFIDKDNGPSKVIAIIPNSFDSCATCGITVEAKGKMSSCLVYLHNGLDHVEVLQRYSFTTYDKQVVNEGDAIYAINVDPRHSPNMLNHVVKRDLHSEYHGENFVYFLKKENARDYLIRFKNVLSYADLEKIGVHSRLIDQDLIPLIISKLFPDEL